MFVSFFNRVAIKLNTQIGPVCIKVLINPG